MTKTVVIATPCYGGLVYFQYIYSILDTIRELTQKGYGVKLIGMGNESLITRARNQLAAEFLKSEASHLLFIDADITWKGSDVVRLLEHDKELIGGIYPLKDYCFNNAEEAIKESYDKEGNFVEKLFRSKVMNYAANFLNNEANINIKKRLCKMKHIPTGFMLIKREVFKKMIKKNMVTKLTQDANKNPDLGPYLYNFFDCKIDEKTGQYLSEDWAFCYNYLKMDEDNNEIYADVSIQLSHTGTHTFDGHFGLKLLPNKTI